jgi:hypothetical protein
MTTDTPTDPEVTFRFESGDYIKMENGNYLILE